VRRLFLPPERLGTQRLILDGDEHRHLGRVLRARTGDKVVIFDGRGNEFDAEVVATGRETTELALGARRDALPATIRLTLLQSVARGERMDWIVQKTCELGVARIVPVLTSRVVARPAGSPTRRARWEKIAREAARQSGRADVPDVAETVSLAQALATSDAQDLRLCLWEVSRGRALRAALPQPPRSTTVLVGPEGGFSEDEIATAEAAGFLTVTLGPRILRVETAAVVAVTLIQASAGGLE
jgi:16S rRNA (uracil1498-N3)-methyltransferase